jgi:hypothetical protein
VNTRRAAAPTIVAVALFTAVALVAGALDDFRFCRLIQLGYFLDPTLLTPCDRATSAPGYDGQFYFAIAHDPFLTRAEATSALDDTLRYRRILYPLLAWVFSAGQPGALPYVLVIINVVAATALIWIAAVAAITAGRSAWWALALAVFGGVWLPIFFDLTEPLQLALLAAGVTSGSAALVLLAGFAKETAGVMLVTEAARGVVQGDRRIVLRFGLAAAVLATWALFVWGFVRGVSESTLGGQFLRPVGAPFIVLADALQHDGERFVLTAAAFTVCVLVIARAYRARDGAALAAAVYAAVVLGAGYDSWRDPLAVFRAMAGAVVLAYFSWLRARDPIGTAAIVLAAASGIAYPLLALGELLR